MIATNFIQRLTGLYRLGVELASLPVVHLHFRSHLCPEHIRSVYKNFTKPHPKYKVFKNKSLGAALIDLGAFASGEQFFEALGTLGQGHAERRRALARGHQLRMIDRNQLVEEIHQINVSCLARQGRPMDPSYVEKQLHYDDLVHYRYYGVFDRQEQLVGYCNVGIFGNFAITDRVLGFRRNNGAMYLLMTEIAAELIDERKVDYLMYDTIFGARPGLREFKRRLGFRPYRAHYTIE